MAIGNSPTEIVKNKSALGDQYKWIQDLQEIKMNMDLMPYLYAPQTNPVERLLDYIYIRELLSDSTTSESKAAQEEHNEENLSMPNNFGDLEPNWQKSNFLPSLPQQNLNEQNSRLESNSDTERLELSKEGSPNSVIQSSPCSLFKLNARPINFP